MEWKNLESFLHQTNYLYRTHFQYVGLFHNITIGFTTPNSDGPRAQILGLPRLGYQTINVRVLEGFGNGFVGAHTDAEQY